MNDNFDRDEYRKIETQYLRDTFTKIMRTTTQRDVSSFVIEYDDACEIIRVRINDDDDYTYACCMTNDDDDYEFHHASFDDRFIVRIALMS